MDTFKKRLANLLTVKSLVTLILTGVFAFLAVTQQIAQDFMTVYAVPADRRRHGGGEDRHPRHSELLLPPP